MSTLAERAGFDVCGPLPTGITVLEASAGTGKTFTIAALATRFVAEGIPLDQLLLVTFTRMATAELRERVRERLTSAERGVARALAGAPPAQRDALVELLAEGPPETVEARRARLAAAISDFDAATIATTHGFCQEVLSGLGVAGDVEPDATLVEDVEDMIEEVVDDLYVRRYHDDPRIDFTRDEALRIARLAIRNPATRIEPADAPADSVAAMRRRLARAAVAELDVRKRRAGVMTYDDLLIRLDETLSGDGGEEAARRLRERYRVVLVDEFQDTDPVQWAIVRRAFGDGQTTLVLIGDPKQAIYAFRGADVYAYLDAAADAGRRATLDVNWRSDQPLIDACDALFGPARLGHAGIVYRSGRACAAGAASRLKRAPQEAALRVRVVSRDHPAIQRTRGGCASNASAREHIARDLAADLAALLASPAELEVRDDDGGLVRRDPIRPGHVAVLVRTHRNAALVRDELARLDVPAVINGAGSVFATDPARDWLRLLEALERPSSAPRARAAALTPFLGWSADRLAHAGEDELEELHRRLHGWARVLRLRGVASLTEALTRGERLPGRLLSIEDGERALTDLRHVAQLLHAAATAEQLGTTALAGWLRQRIAAAERETGDEERSRRLESDEEAVQILTIHRSKGLEFPVVYFPYLWEPSYIPQGKEPIFFHDPEHGDARTIDVGLDGDAFDAHQRQHEAEQRGEDLRLAYVALTRAKHQAVLWWAGSWDQRNSALGRLLFARDEAGNVPARGPATPSDDAARARLELLAGAVPGAISVERAEVAGSGRLSRAGTGAAQLAAATFGRGLDWSWRRTSYSDITAGTHEARVGSEPDLDEPEAAPDEAGVAAGGRLPATGSAEPDDVPAALADMPGGVGPGTFVHAVLEAADFAAADLDAELAGRMEAVLARRRIELGDLAAIRDGLRRALETPLGADLGDLRLRDLERADRLDELAFELPLVGGDDPSAVLRLAAVAEVVGRHTAPGDPLAGYAERLADPALRQDVRGYLTGSIDLVARVPGASGPRFLVADYKTNRLAGPGEELTTWHYRPEALSAEMQSSHYALQALLYVVALHRYLRWRLPGYDPALHLAGVRYLFVRGMVGESTPVRDGIPRGVFAWTPPPALVSELSDVLAAGEAQ